MCRRFDGSIGVLTSVVNTSPDFRHADPVAARLLRTVVVVEAAVGAGSVTGAAGGPGGSGIVTIWQVG
jgi:hypothetical protein